MSESVEIERVRQGLVGLIRKYSVSQKDLWCCVPFFAFEADGRFGWCDNRSRAYRDGLWALEASAENGHYHIFVDLATGRLVNPWGNTKGVLKTPADDKYVLRMAGALEQLDAERILRSLQQEARKPYWDGDGKFPENARRNKKDKAELKKQLNIQEIYVRT